MGGIKGGETEKMSVVDEDYAKEDYAKYYYLWHLIAIKALDVKNPAPTNPEHCPRIKKTAWDFTSHRTPRIGLIDMGVAPYHPNLDPQDPADPGQIDWENAIDFASHPGGVRNGRFIDVPSEARHFERVKHFLDTAPSGADIGLPNDQAAIVDAIRDQLGVRRYLTAYDQRYSVHGTACAGLTSGKTFDNDQFGEQGNISVYFGVDPDSQVVPITTSISPDPEQLIAAFLYAYAQDVDVILFPRDVADPAFWPGYGALGADEKTRLHSTLAGEPPGDAVGIDARWRTLEAVIRWVSEAIPVVCAAGNDGRSSLIYPASLSSGSNGIISVGAVSYQGYRSGYSNYAPDLTVVAPSDDGEIYNRYQTRLDRKSDAARDFFFSNDLHKKRRDPHDPIPDIPFSPERLVSLDVPGPRGYVEGTREGYVRNRDDAKDDPSGLYGLFGGTSGAAALVAGAVSLMQRKSINKLTGIEIKDHFESLATDADRFDISHWYWADHDVLQPDGINGYAVPDLGDLFGRAGLLNLNKLLALV